MKTWGWLLIVGNFIGVMYDIAMGRGDLLGINALGIACGAIIVLITYVDEELEARNEDR